jgi:hypothetical protein
MCVVVRRRYPMSSVLAWLKSHPYGAAGAFVVYPAVAAFWMYGPGGPGAILVFVALHLALGAGVCRWWVVAMPIVLVPLAIGTSTGDAGPGWGIALELAFPIAALLTALGVLLGRRLFRPRPV